jgi:hypothetical protein
MQPLRIGIVMNKLFLVDLIHNAALLLALGLIYDILYRGKRETLSVLNQITSGMIIGVMVIFIMLNPLESEPGIFFDARTILLGLTGLFFGIIPTLLAMAIASVYRFILGGGGTPMGVATIFSSGLFGLAWRHYRFRESKELSFSELYLFGVVVHTTNDHVYVPASTESHSKHHQPLGTTCHHYLSDMHCTIGESAHRSTEKISY